MSEDESEPDLGLDWLTSQLGAEQEENEDAEPRGHGESPRGRPTGPAPTSAARAVAHPVDPVTAPLAVPAEPGEPEPAAQSGGFNWGLTPSIAPDPAVAPDAPTPADAPVAAPGPEAPAAEIVSAPAEPAPAAGHTAVEPEEESDPWWATSVQSPLVLTQEERDELEQEDESAGWPLRSPVSTTPVSAAVPAEPALPAPVLPEPVPAEPVLAEPVLAEPVPADPVPADPVPADPVPAEPVPAEPVPAEPVPADLVPTDPVPAEPVPAATPPAEPESVETVSAAPVPSSAAPIPLVPTRSFPTIPAADASVPPADDAAGVFGLFPVPREDLARNPSVDAAAGGGPRGPGRTTTRNLARVGAGVLAVLVLVGLFFLGQRLTGGTSAPAAAPAPSATPTATATPTAEATGSPSDASYVWDTLYRGECLQPYTTPWAEKFTVVDCASPHAAQLVYRGVFPGGPSAPFPGEAAFAAQINLLCGASGVIDLAAAGALSDLQLQGSYPITDKQWTGGDRAYYCFVSRSSAKPLSGSIAGPGPGLSPTK